MSKRRSRLMTLTATAVLLTGVACNRVPGYVIKPDDMAELMADIRMADAIVNVRRDDYTTDAKKMALRNAVFERHGVTSEQFDTSLMWYGKNIDRYQEVTQQTIEILEKRLKDASVLAAGEAAMSVSGDSVDIWEYPRAFVINQRSPSQYITFDFDTDQNWEKGDVYTLRARLLTPLQYAQWNITAVYDDGAVETITSNIALDNPARQEMTLVTDSTRTATHISGWINLEPSAGRPAIADSIGLMRRRTSPALAASRKYIQKLIAPKKNEGDTIPSVKLEKIDTASQQPAESPTPSKEKKVSGELRKVKRE